MTRTLRVQVLLTESEKKELIKKANKKGMKLSTYLRYLVLKESD